MNSAGVVWRDMRRLLMLAASAGILALVVAGSISSAVAPALNGNIVFQGTSIGGTETGFSYSNLYNLEPSTGKIVQLTDSPLVDANPAWSPDGSKVAFDSSRGTDEGFSIHKIFIVNRDGSGVQRLTSGMDADYAPTWSPDGRRIAFARWGTGRTTTSG